MTPEKIDLSKMEFDARNPTGEGTVKVRFADGRLYYNVCRVCGKANGGGIINDARTAADHDKDNYAPHKRPCVWCKGSPVIMRWEDTDMPVQFTEGGEA